MRHRPAPPAPPTPASAATVTLRGCSGSDTEPPEQLHCCLRSSAQPVQQSSSIVKKMMLLSTWAPPTAAAIVAAEGQWCTGNLAMQEPNHCCWLPQLCDGLWRNNGCERVGTFSPPSQSVGHFTKIQIWKIIFKFHNIWKRHTGEHFCQHYCCF